MLDVGAEAIVLLGDMPYIDSTELAVQRRRYREFYSVPDVSAALGKVPFYATWDDHDFGRNDTNGLLPGKENSRQAFLENHANPSYGEDGVGIYTHFRRGPVDVFLLDARTFAGTEPSPFDAEKTSLLGAAQWKWLERELAASTAPFKILATGMIWNGATRPGKKDHWMTYPHERQAVFDYIGEKRISGVVLVGGDIHRSRALRYPTTESAGYELTELITSPLANTVIEAANAPSPHLLHDVGQKETFLLVTVDMTAKPPTLVGKCMNAAGEELFEVALDLAGLTAE
jgi:alkaline phosphatase D